MVFSEVCDAGLFVECGAIGATDGLVASTFALGYEALDIGGGVFAHMGVCLGDSEDVGLRRFTVAGVAVDLIFPSGCGVCL